MVTPPSAVQAANWSCCVPRSVLGDATPVVRIDESQGQYYVTADPDCKSAIASDAYPSTYQAIWMCGNCTGDDCVPADGGEAGPTQQLGLENFV
jgi:hypothetical protein